MTWRTSCSRRRQKIFKCEQGTGAILHYAAAGQRWLRLYALRRRQPLCCPLRMARRVQRWRFVFCLKLCCVVLAFFVKQIYCCQLQILLVATTALHKSEASATGSPVCTHAVQASTLLPLTTRVPLASSRNSTCVFLLQSSHRVPIDSATARYYHQLHTTFPPQGCG